MEVGERPIQRPFSAAGWRCLDPFSKDLATSGLC